MHLLGLDFEPRIPRLSDRRLYAFETSPRYGMLAPLFGQWLNRDLIVSPWTDHARVIRAMLDRHFTPYLLLNTIPASPHHTSPARARQQTGSTQTPQTTGGE